VNSERRLQHEPALDGLRGVAVAGVVLFHAGRTWAIGGYLGVSTFFTLSGFLITSLLLAERESTGRLDLPAFWGRRARRLLPAALATLLGVAVLAPALATAEQLATLRGDVVAALGYVANWRFILAGRSYGDLFAAPSPVLHFWSLAIEEQLYLAFPIVVLLLSRRRRLLAPILGALVLGSVALSFVLYSPGGSTDAAYYGTGVRAGELLVGALLAVLVPGARTRVRAPGTRALGVAVVGCVALVGLLVLWGTTRQDETWLYRGGFVLHALLSAAVVAACLVPGPVRSVLSVGPLRALGRISYGVYLYHWPVFVWYDGSLVAQLGLTLALAIASFVLLEQPIRERRWRVPIAIVPVAMVVVAVAALASTLDPPAPPRFDLASGEEPTPSDPAVVLQPDAPVVAIFGDSTALRTGFALKGYGWLTGAVDVRDGGADIGCPLARGGVVDFVSHRAKPDSTCERWPARWRAIAHDDELDAAIVQVGPWDVSDRVVDGRTTHIGEPAYDELLEAEMQRAVDALSADGAVVVWLTAPHIDFGRGAAGLPKTSVDHISDPARMDRLNELIRKVDAARPEMVVVDLAAHLRSLPGGEMDPDLRPDGVHFSEEASKTLAGWLVDEVKQAVGSAG
jgi:peptidoglycan/LPS O-acetylase OafA/YrhL